MSTLGSIESAIANHFTSGHSATPGLSIGNVDVGKVLEIVQAIISAAPAISEGVMTAAPFVAAISTLIELGGKPTDEQWTALRTQLDANSMVLTDAEAAAKEEIAASETNAKADAPAPGTLEDDVKDKLADKAPAIEKTDKPIVMKHSDINDGSDKAAAPAVVTVKKDK